MRRIVGSAAAPGGTNTAPEAVHVMLVVLSVVSIVKGNEAAVAWVV